MANNNGTGDGSKPRDDQQALSRREFVTAGAAAGVGAVALLGAREADAQNDRWDYDVDVVIAGGGCAGITAAIRARDLGCSVLVVDQNFDLGGRMLHSGSFVSLGGGDPLQKRDMKGESDKEGFVTSPPVESPKSSTTVSTCCSRISPIGPCSTVAVKRRIATTSAR